MNNLLQKIYKLLLIIKQNITKFFKEINLKNIKKLVHASIHSIYQITKTLKKHFKIFKKHPAEYTKWLLNKIITRLTTRLKKIYSYIKKPTVLIPLGSILILSVILFSAYSYLTHPPRVNEQIIESKISAQQYLDLLTPIYNSGLTEKDSQTYKALTAMKDINISQPNKFILSLTLGKYDLDHEMDIIDNNHDVEVYSSTLLHVEYLEKLNDLILPLANIDKETIETTDLVQFVNQQATSLQQIDPSDYSLETSTYSRYESVLQQIESDAYEYSQTKNLVRWTSQYQQQRQALIQIYQNDVNNLIYSDITKLSELFSDYERIEFLLKDL